jgi:hypothetical protein
MITAIQLTRLTMAFGAVSDVWFVILLTQARSEYVYMPVHGMAHSVRIGRFLPAASDTVRPWW